MTWCIINKKGAYSMKKSLIANIVTFMQPQNDKNQSVHAEFTQCDYVRSTVGGGALN